MIDHVRETIYLLEQQELSPDDQLRKQWLIAQFKMIANGYEGLTADISEMTPEGQRVVLSVAMEFFSKMYNCLQQLADRDDNVVSFHIMDGDVHRHSY